MKIHHLNCGTMCPVCKRLINGSEVELFCAHDPVEYERYC